MTEASNCSCRAGTILYLLEWESEPGVWEPVSVFDDDAEAHCQLSGLLKDDISGWRLVTLAVLKIEMTA